MKNKGIEEILTKIYDKPTELLLSKKETEYIKECLKNKVDYNSFTSFYHADKILAKTANSVQGVKLEIQRSFLEGKLMQSGMMHECNVLATFASIFNLNKVCNLQYDDVKLHSDIIKNIPDNARYVYYNKDIFDTYLFHLGGPTNIDAYFYYKGILYKIEIKDRRARSGEVDVVSYTEQGKLNINDEFIEKHGEYIPFIEDFNNSNNIIEHMGHNILLSSNKKKDVMLRYFEKNDIDLILTVTSKNELVALTKDDADLIDTSNSEIRTAGKNSIPLFTPELFKKIITEKGATLIDNENETYIIDKTKLIPRIRRGSVNSVSGYKFSNFFFIRNGKFKYLNDGNISFSLKDVLQLKPTISVHMSINYNFGNLRWNFYNNHLNIKNPEDEAYAIAEQLSLFDE